MVVVVCVATESLVLFADESLVRVDGSVALAETGAKVLMATESLVLFEDKSLVRVDTVKSGAYGVPGIWLILPWSHS